MASIHYSSASDTACCFYFMIFNFVALSYIIVAEKFYDITDVARHCTLAWGGSALTNRVCKF